PGVQPIKPLQGFLKKRVFTHQGEKLLGVQLSGHWPETTARPSGKNNGKNHESSSLLSNFLNILFTPPPPTFNSPPACGRGWGRVASEGKELNSSIRHPTSDIRHPTSDVRPPTIQGPTPE